MSHYPLPAGSHSLNVNITPEQAQVLYDAYINSNNRNTPSLEKARQFLMFDTLGHPNPEEMVERARLARTSHSLRALSAIVAGDPRPMGDIIHALRIEDSMALGQTALGATLAGIRESSDTLVDAGEFALAVQHGHETVSE